MKNALKKPAEKNMHEKKPDPSRGSLNPAGIGIGLGVGLCFGAAMDNIAIGLLLGVSFGTSFSILLGRRKDK